MMLRLLRSDLHRLLHARWPWVVLALVALATLGSAILTIWWPLEPGVVYEGLTGPAGALRAGGRSASVGLVLTVAPLVAAHLSCADSDCGFDRTLLASVRGRVSYFAEKYLFVALVSGMVLLAYLAFGGLGALVTARPVEGVEPLWQVVAWAAEGWLAGCVYALVVLLAGQLTRSRALAYIVALLLVTAAVEQGFIVFLLTVGDLLHLDWGPALEAAAAWMPYVTSTSVVHGAASMLAVDASGVTPALRAVAVGLPVCLGAGAFGALAGARRDLA